MRLSARILLVVILALVGVCNSDGDLDESSDRLDDFGDLSLDDNESEPHSDLSHLSDDEFLAGDAEGGAAAGPGRPGEVQAEKSAMMLRVMGATLKRPGMTQRFGQILPIIRVMSPPQRLALVSLVMQQAMVPEHVNEPPLQMAMRLGATPDGKSNLTTQLLLPLSADIAHIFRGAGLPQGLPDAGPDAAGHQHQEQDQGQVGQGRSVGGQGGLFRPQHQVPPPRWQKPHAGVVSAAMPPPLAGPRAPPHLEVPQQRPQQRPQRFYGDLDLQPPPGVNRRSGHIGLGMRPPPPPGRTPTTLRPSTTPPREHHGCSLFSDTVCATVDHYPEEAILASMDADKHTVDALLTDKAPPGARSVALPEMQRRQDDDYPPGSPHAVPQDLDAQDGQDGADDTHLCASVIKYARPQRARATSGQWKFIVNTAEHTQTLRLEKCTRLDEPCNYMPDKVRSHCTQVYNYHRLLTWDKEQGLHIDIFKVPTCCSCQVLKSPFLTSNAPPRRPGGYVPPHLQQQQQPIADFSQQHETVVVSESGRPVPPQYALKPFNQQVDESRREPLPASKPAGSSKPTWPFRRAATRRPPVQGQGLHGQYGLQTLEDGAGPGDLLPQYPPLQDQYPPLAGRRTGSTRNRTRLSDPDDLTAEGTVRRAAPAILHPDGSAVPNAVRVPAAIAATSKRPLPPVLPPRLETYRPRATTAAATAKATASTTQAPIIIPTSTAAPGAPSTPTPKRVNYSYHPIIDFFRPLEKQMSAQEPRHAAPSAPAAPPPQAAPQVQEVAEQRTAPDDAPLPGPSWSAQQSDWSPITQTPSKR